MKHSFLFACLLFCLAGLLPDPAAGADPVPVEKTESVPEPEEIMVGEWIGFIFKKDAPVYLTRIRYVFLKSGTWEIRDEAAGATPEQQGWYKINQDENKLLLQPREAAIKNELAAIHADLKDKDTFIIPDMVDKDKSLTFVRKDALIVSSPGSLAGKWKIIQSDPDSEETRVAPYTLVLKKDGTYSLEQPDKELPEEWAQGTFSIDGLRIQFHNKFTGDGLWKSPSFFLLNDELRYNDSRCLVWGERIQDKDKDAQVKLEQEK